MHINAKTHMESNFHHILYIGTVRVISFHHNDRVNIVKGHMEEHREYCRAKPVELSISLFGIKVCSPDGKVQMAHALRRISYATCDVAHSQFCFLSREPKGHFSNQFLHLFVAESAKQAEELNVIVGNAFRMAYAAQLRKQSPSVTQKPQQNSPETNNWEKESNKSMDSENNNRPNNISGLSTFDMNSSSESTPTSDDNNSPMELNIYRRLIETPPVLNNEKGGGGGICTKTSDCLPSIRPTPEGCTSHRKDNINEPYNNNNNNSYSPNHYNNYYVNTAHRTQKLRTCLKNNESTENNVPNDNESIGKINKVTLTPERNNSLVKLTEESELRSAPWFQAGIPREITLEVLGEEPVGSFMVRESTTKAGCYALSVRVPREYYHRGIAHYLILKTNKGYKIKGFTKEFCTLTALITHHSVMQELLPCPLSLSRYNPTFTKSDNSKDFADIDSDPDYNTLADFRKMMADLNV